MQVDQLPIQAKLQILKHLMDQSDEKEMVKNINLSNDKEEIPDYRIFEISLVEQFPSEKCLIRDISKLNAQGWIMQDGFIEEGKIGRVCAEIKEFCQSRDLKSAKMSQDGNLWANANLRGDRVMWIHEEDDGLGEDLKYLISKMDMIREEFNEHLKFESHSYEVMDCNLENNDF
jgi:hypothetical protein